jgi:hypothetical protein
LKEFLVSNRLEFLPLLPSQDVIDNLKTLCAELLQPIRDRYAKPIIISSGYRTSELNKAVGGSDTSDHLFGKAADLVVSDLRGLYDFIKTSGFSYDQLILENGCVHVGYRSLVANRNQAYIQ